MGAVEVEPLLIKILKSYWVDIRVIYLILGLLAGNYKNLLN